MKCCNSTLIIRLQHRVPKWALVITKEVPPLSDSLMIFLNKSNMTVYRMLLNYQIKKLPSTALPN